ncbi:hypothetical protein [Defluviimonas salinarum]|uniref:HAMP domain-containing protein n=1 Tax=Defluviimonas salinarum TaxID=2992147 RepID=A0ABT3J6X2_9RHOB|nr:hypothetical protein [Defluviimonas salinarum]MCW3783438.1 hypothetical protein [Defluviimonas salinarum]
MAILWRLWATAAGVMLAVLLVFLALSTFQFSRVHSDLVGERLIVLADRTAAPFQAAVRLGLPIASVRNAVGILERARRSDDRISAIYVFDREGGIVHATLGEAGDGPEVAAVRARMIGAQEWHGEIASGFIAGVNIAGPSSDWAGGIAVLYPRGGSTTRVWAMAAELSVAVLGIFVLGALTAGLLLRIGLRRIISAFDRVDAAIADFERDTWRREDEAAPASGLRADLDESYDQYRSAVAELRHLEAGRPT